MIRLMNMNAVFLAVTVAVAFGNYHVKYEAQRKAAALAKIDAQISREDEQLKVLDAEWSHLNEPERLQALAERHLALGRISAEQVVLVSDLPARFELQDAKSPARSTVRTPAVMPAAQISVDDR